MMKVSVIIPVYNAEKYLEKCIESLCHQSLYWNEYEVIAVDDGSTDHSLDILLNLKERYKNLFVFHQHNQGAAAARNFGLGKAKGEYIGFVDSDDWVERRMYETMYDAAKMNNADIVFCNLFSNEKKMKPYLETGVYDEEGIQNKIYPRLISSCDEMQYGTTLRGSVCLKLFRHKLIAENAIKFHEELIYNEDGFFSIEMTLKSCVYVYMGEEFLYRNNVNATSITKRYINDLWMRQKKLIFLLEDCTKNIDYPFSQQIAKKAFEIAVYSIENEIKRNNTYKMLDKRRHVKLILKDVDLQEYIKKLTYEKLSRIQKMYLFAFRRKMPLLALFTAKYRYRKNKYI